MRQWLIANHNKEKECWVAVRRGKPTADDTFLHLDAVEEAQCLGWIDSTPKRLEKDVTVQRLAPRRKNSAWSEFNKELCRRMETLGLMTNAGCAGYPICPPRDL